MKGLKPTTKGALDLLKEGTIALARVEANGIRIDTAYLDRVIGEMRTQEAELVAEMMKDEVYAAWRKRFGQRTNIGSLPQMAEVVFKELGYQSPGTTASGRDRSDKNAFDHVDLPFVRRHIEWRGIRDACGKYLEGLRREVVGGYFHPTFNLHSVSTFRSSSGVDRESGGSSGEYNFQNIPIRNPKLGDIIRRCFIPREGCILAEVDFSGIEVRVAACYTKDPNLIKYIEDPSTDMHRDTAADLFLLDRSQVEKRTTRDWAKNRFVFPQFYGSVFFQCAPHLWEAVELVNPEVPGTGLTLKEHLRKRGVKRLGDCTPGQDPAPGTFCHHVKQVERSFWQERFKVYTAWKERWYGDYLRLGGFHTLTGFTIRGLFKRNQVLNSPIQGSAFHCLLWSLIRIQRELRKRKIKARIVGQIHDSIIFDCPETELLELLSLAKRIMTEELRQHWKWICVPMDVEAEASPLGGSWADKKAWREEGGVWGAVT